MPGSETNRWRQIALFLLTFGVLAILAILIKPFFPAITGAIIIAVITQRPYRWLSARITRPDLCATIALILIVLSIVTPVFFLAQSVGEQLAGIIATVRSPDTQQKISDFFARHPALSSRILDLTSGIDQQRTTQSVATYFGSKMATIIGSSFGAITQIVILLFILYFLLRDRSVFCDYARSLIPLDKEETDILMNRLEGTILATALGRMTIAVIQGLFGGIAYWLLGVPNAFLWGVLTAVMAMIPAFGAVLVWAPIALYLGLNGHWLKAAGLALWGGVIVSTIDNFLYPIMVGPQIKQHSVAVLLSILGGVALFGITGIVLGPLVFTAAATLLEIWRARSLSSDTAPIIVNRG